MGISSALYSGVSGLNTNSAAMTVIGNNLANTNTLGFKGSRTVFSDLLSSTINGSGGTSQVGRGVNVSKVDNIFSQGTFESTESGLDVAIEGASFFMVSEEGNDANLYTRAGAFRFDENGYLVNPEGLRVQGKAYDVNGALVAGDPEDIQIENTGLIAGNPTDEMTLTTNLDAAAVIPPAPAAAVAESQAIDLSTTIVDPGGTLTFTIDGQPVVYNNATAGSLTGAALAADIATLGSIPDIGNGTGYSIVQAGATAVLDITQLPGSEGPITAIATTNSTPANGNPSGTETTGGALAVSGFNYLDPATFNYSSSTQVFDSLGEPHLMTTYFVKTAANTWNWFWSAENAGGPFGSAVSATPSGTITFNPDGTMNSGGGPNQTSALNWGNGSDPAQTIDITFNTTQFDSESTVISQDQNGFGAGNLTSVDIDGEGVVIASYSNGEQIKVASLVLAKFNNPNGLELVGNNLFESSDTSGSPRVGLPGSELGKVFTNSLEQSNVDMGAEFVRMITVQRGFQANSKIITTVDELLGELINLKR